MTRRDREPDLDSLSASPFQFLLKSMGFDPESDEGLRDTPARMRRAYQELLSGYNMSRDEVLGRTFPTEGYDGPIISGPIPFDSLCEHHLLPFSGVASVVYRPRDRVVGISKLSRLVEMHSRRLQIQECMTHDIAQDLQEVLNPAGVGVVVVGEHMCMSCRGVRKRGTKMTTASWLGIFQDVEIRQEMLTMIDRVKP